SVFRTDQFRSMRKVYSENLLIPSETHWLENTDASQEFFIDKNFRIQEINADQPEDREKSIQISPKTGEYFSDSPVVHYKISLLAGKIMNLNQVTVPSADVARSIRFYQKLGLKLIVKNLPDYARFECTEGDSTFSVHKAEKLPEGEGTIVYFETQDLERLTEKLILDGIVFETGPALQDWLWKEASLKDPDGNRIILFTAGENRKNPPWRLSS
ncbi:MAG TPA: VOC family protein, partial [Leptospiraceae bacterium]|nr:VOC family protein [Leptospiraceae bacterium]